MRAFNTAGPVVQEDHYSIPPLDRLDLDGVLSLIHGKKYFSLHAPRQTGKTSTLLALQSLLNSGSEGPYRCVYLNVEPGQTARDDVTRVMAAVLDELALSAETTLGDEEVDRICNEALARARPDNALRRVLTRWARVDPRPLVLLVDEIDALVGEGLLAVLWQLRGGYHLRPHGFPHSIILCGVRDLRDYQIHSRTAGHPVAGGSAFNISAGSLRLGDFSEREVKALLGQHTAETGQPFQPEAVRRVWLQTCGQPWLVNALCARACFGTAQGRDRNRPITEDDVLEAQEHLIQSRVVHLDQLADKLQEERVRRVIEPFLTGSSEHDFSTRDYEYVRDLGLIAADDPLRIANPIYAELIPRELTFVVQKAIQQETGWYVGKDGGLRMSKLLEAFRAFFRQHSAHWLETLGYKEAGPHLLLYAFFHRIINEGGRIEREYALGRGRAGLLILWPQGARQQRIAVECKVLNDSLETEVSKALPQTASYMDVCAAHEGHLVLFDRDKKLWKDKVFRRSETVNGVPVEVWGM